MTYTKEKETPLYGLFDAIITAEASGDYLQAARLYDAMNEDNNTEAV